MSSTCSQKSSAARSGEKDCQEIESPLPNHSCGKFQSKEVPPDKKYENGNALHLAGIAFLFEALYLRRPRLLNYIGSLISERVRNNLGGGGMILTGENKNNQRKTCTSEILHYFKLALR